MLSTSDFLCLACSSSLPPAKSKSSQDIFVTRCCQRPICPACIASNPRLTRYEPCLACLGGVQAVTTKSNEGRRQASPGPPRFERVNVDAAIRDEDTFVLGDASDEDPDDGPDELRVDVGVDRLSLPPSNPDPSTSANGGNELESEIVVETSDSSPNVENTAPKVLDGEVTVPSIYYLEYGDTLQSIALRFGVNRHELCKLNTLPLSTLTTTPHILHTRSFIKLPATARLRGGLSLAEREQHNGTEEEGMFSAATK